MNRNVVRSNIYLCKRIRCTLRAECHKVCAIHIAQFIISTLNKSNA